MKIIVAGSRAISNYDLVSETIKRFLQDHGLTVSDIEIVSGGANGVDRLAERWAIENSAKLSVFKAEWDRFGKSAGMIRNKKMREYANGLIAIWDGYSKGTKNMIMEARSHGLTVLVKNLKTVEIVSVFC